MYLLAINPYSSAPIFLEKLIIYEVNHKDPQYHYNISRNKATQLKPNKKTIITA